MVELLIELLHDFAKFSPELYDAVTLDLELFLQYFECHVSNSVQNVSEIKQSAAALSLTDDLAHFRRPV